MSDGTSEEQVEPCRHVNSARSSNPLGSPAYLRSNNGPEFIAKKIQQWLAANQIKTIYIEPGSPWQNGFVESFHGRLRDECLNREQLWTLTEARVVIEDYRCQYNHPRPHSKLGYQAQNASRPPPKRSISGSSRRRWTNQGKQHNQ